MFNGGFAMKVKFVIFARKVDGSEFECFRWCRDARSGIDRALIEAKQNGIEVSLIWAVPV
jgi:hypothetical protein